jgi:hypothetical protein
MLSLSGLSSLTSQNWNESQVEHHGPEQADSPINLRMGNGIPRVKQVQPIRVASRWSSGDFWHFSGFGSPLRQTVNLHSHHTLRPRTCFGLSC